MKPALITLSLVSLGVAQNFRIYFNLGLAVGRTHEWISWTSGSDPCTDFTALAAPRDTPCGVAFNLDGYDNLAFKKCPDAVTLYQEQVVLISNCYAHTTRLHCEGESIKTKWTCEVA